MPKTVYKQFGWCVCDLGERGCVSSRLIKYVCESVELDIAACIEAVENMGITCYEEKPYPQTTYDMILDPSGSPSLGYPMFASMS